MFYIIRCGVCIFVWLILSDKRRWREILPVCFMASLLGFVTDHIMMYYKLWDYHGIHPLRASFSNNLICYVVISYLFIQFLPMQKNYLKMFRYFFIWTSIALVIEIIHVKYGYLQYHQWWTMLDSYIADWVLYYIFYKYYVIFRFEKLA